MAIVSLVVHVGLLSAAAGWSYARITEKEEPIVPVVVSSRPQPPPPAASPAATPRRAAPRKSKKPALAKVVQDKPIPREQPEPASSPVPGGVVGGVEGGVPGGVVGGVLGAKPKIVPQFMFDRDRVSSPDPHLPDWFNQQHPHETVSGLYRICVGTDGHITDVQIMKGIAGVDKVIQDHIRATWRYKPQPVPVCSPRVFKFQIN